MSNSTLPDDRITAIADDRSHGAAELARQSLEVLAAAARDAPADSSEQWRADLTRLAHGLCASRPSMTPVLRLVSLWLNQLQAAAADPLHRQRQQASEAARELIRLSEAATGSAARHAAMRLAGCRSLVTHSYSSTVLEAIRQLDAHVHVMFSESRPRYEGHRLAQALSRHGHRATLVTDALLGAGVQRADAVLVGADSVLTDGALVNKAGTLPLAATAAYFAVPVYVCCESHKLRTADMPPVELERMAAEELGAPNWSGITVENVYFDVTPPGLLNGCITESGLQTFPGYREIG